MFFPLSRGLPLLGLGLALPAWACPALATLSCGQSVNVTDVWWDAGDFDSQCALADTWDGGDFTIQLSVPNGRRAYVDTYVNYYQCYSFDCSGDPPDVDLFVYDANSCVDWSNQGCIDSSMNFVLEDEHADWVSDGGTYFASVDEYWGIYGDYDFYDATFRLNCPVACNPALATPITCSTDFLNQPVGTSDVMDYYACGTPFDHLPQPQPETIYSFTPQATGTVRFVLQGMTHDFDIYVLDNACDQFQCLGSSTLASTSTDSVQFSAVFGHTYYIVIEAYDPLAVSQGGNYDLSFDVGTAGCHEDCNDTLDNDNDLAADCADVGDCCTFSSCQFTPQCCPDGDGDGYYPPACLGNDCDDRPGQGGVHPGATEICNGRDDDCDDITDEGTPCYDDDDDGWTENGGDCDDADATERPGATEARDGSDDDCDGTIDEGTTAYDDDGDCACEVAPCVGSIFGGCGPLVGGDCRDGDPDVGPSEAEIAQNGIDDDCDGSVDAGIYDPDGDGITAGGGDCNDADGTVYPGAVEEADGVDDDCDGTADEGTTAHDDDGDGACEGVDLDSDGDLDCSDGTAPGDCADHDATIHAGASEVDGNGIDDDCDDRVDEGTNATDDDGDGLSEDEGDCDDAAGSVNPGAEEVANDADDDCDGEIDEGFRDADGDGVTIEEGDCDDGAGWVRPGLLDVCDEIDNDCDDEVDEDCEVDESGTGPGAVDQQGCNCATGGGSGAWAVLLGLLAVRRRRLAAVPLLAACSNEVDVNPLAAELSIETQLIDLGDVAVGSDLPFAVDVIHERGAGALVEAVDVFNLEGDAFAANSELPEIPVGGTVPIGLMYSPREAGWHQAVVTVMTDADLTPELVVHVRAHAVVADVSVWPRLVDFGPVAPGDVETRTLTVTNSGVVDVVVQSTALTHPRFGVVTVVPVTVAAGTTSTVDVAFAPSDDLSATDLLSFTLDVADLSPVELFGNACAIGLPDLYDTDGDGWTSCGGDCDDSDPTVRPGGEETVDGADEDCDGTIDEGTPVWDDDGDCACEAPPCLGSEGSGCSMSVESDCADGATAIGPVAVEDPDNGIDDDCDGVVDQGTTDLDGDGYSPAGGDCDDTSATRFPGATETPNGVDDDCDVTADEGTVRYDDDGDGRCEQGPCTYGTSVGDCDDRPTLGAACYVGATEAANGRDDDCDGTVDEGTNAYDDDGDGFSNNAGDCNDANASVYPGAGCP